MKGQRKPWIVAVLLVVPLLLTACGGGSEQAAEEPAVLEEIAGTDMYRVTLTEKAAQRLDIQTATVQANGSGTVIPYGAVLYSTTGETWAYTNPKGLTFERQQIVVERVVGDQAHLSKGPSAGTKVATVGVAELYGAETGVGGEH